MRIFISRMIWCQIMFYITHDYFSYLSSEPVSVCERTSYISYSDKNLLHM